VSAERLEPPSRDDVLAILSMLGTSAPDEAIEKIGSLEQAWLISQIEERYNVTLDLSDEMLARMATVSGAVEVLAQMLVSVEDA
jgi:HEPN domain-containing protein